MPSDSNPVQGIVPEILLYDVPVIHKDDLPFIGHHQLLLYACKFTNFNLFPNFKSKFTNFNLFPNFKSTVISY